MQENTCKYTYFALTVPETVLSEVREKDGNVTVTSNFGSTENSKHDFYAFVFWPGYKKVKGKQSPGTGAIRTKVPPSKPKWEITKITISQNPK